MFLEAIVEIPQNSKYKYEIRKSDDALVLDRVLSFPNPFNYGFLTNTLSEDGDALDVFILSNEAIAPKTVVTVVLLGAFTCTDNAYEDNKMVACLKGEEDKWILQGSLKGETIRALNEINFYLQNYKDGFKVVTEVLQAPEIIKLHQQARERAWREDNGY